MLNTTELIIVFAVAIAVLIGVGFLVANLNREPDQAGKDALSKYLEPFELSFGSTNKQLHAAGLIQKSYAVFEIQKKGKQRLIKMRTRMNLRGVPDFVLCTTSMRYYIVSHGYKAAKEWSLVKDKIYAEALTSELKVSTLYDTLSAETIKLIYNFEEEQEGMLVYPLEATIFGSGDQLLSRAYTELADCFALFTYIIIHPGLPSKDFEDFVNQSVQLAQALEKDLSALSTIKNDEQDHHPRLQRNV